MDNFESFSTFWHYSHPDVKCHGKVMVNPSSGVVFICSDKLKKPGKAYNILGFLDSNVPITLYKCCYCGNNFFSADMLLIGCHFTNPSSVRINRLRLYIDKLDDWFMLHNFHGHPLIKHVSPRRSFLCNYDDYSMRVAARTHGDISFRRNENNLSYIEVQSRSRVSLERAFNILGDLRKLFVFILGIDLNVLRAACFVENGNSDIIELIYSPIYYEDQQRGLYYSGLAYSKIIYEDMGILIERWLLLCNKLRQLINVFFATYTRTIMWPEDRFLAYMSAIEYYHRNRIKKQYVEKEKQKKIIRNILKAIPKGIDSEYRDKIKGTLAFTNQCSLKTIIREIIEEAGTCGKRLLKARKVKMKQIRNARNYYTHYDDAIEKYKMDSKRIYSIGSIIKYLIIILLLKEMKIDEGEIANIMKMDLMYDRIAKPKKYGK